jgi:hypothetical protein
MNFNGSYSEFNQEYNAKYYRIAAIAWEIMSPAGVLFLPIEITYQMYRRRLYYFSS